jgi:3-oxoacyl-[acyl-carrier-protein] synthase II
MTHPSEAVITGWGVVSPIGVGREAFAASIRAERSGVGRISNLDVSYLPVPIGAEIRDFEPKQYVRPRKSLKVMGREIQTAFAAATMAMDQAGLSKGGVDPDRLGVVLGSETMSNDHSDVQDAFRKCMVDGEFRFERWGPEAMSNIYPLWMLKYLPNMPACHIAIAYDGRGPNNTIALGEASSLLAVMEGVEIILRGAADVMVVGGTSSRVNLTDFLWRGDSRLSHRVDEPESACRPFDAGRDGMVLGEGAGAFVLERRQHADQRGATVLARVMGWGCAFEPPLDGYVIRPSTVRRSIAAALERANMGARDIGHVNAHGLSTVEDDRSEAEAIRDTLGEAPVTAPKSYFGNSGAGGGAVEMAVSVLSFADREVPPTLNYEQPDPACPVNVVRGEPLVSDRPTALVLNHSGTGQAAAVVLTAE